jgi:hypothetical protein
MHDHRCRDAALQGDRKRCWDHAVDNDDVGRASSRDALQVPADATVGGERQPP